MVNNYIRANSLFSWRISRAIAYKDEMRAGMEERGGEREDELVVTGPDRSAAFCWRRCSDDKVLVALKRP